MKSLVFATVLGVLVASPAYAASYDFAPKSALVYTAAHPLRKVHGESNTLKGFIKLPENGNFEGANIEIAIPMKSFTSKRMGMTQHMLNVVKAARFPEVTFKSDAIKVLSTEKKGDATHVVGEITGTINFHGKSKQIKTKVTAAVTANQIVSNTEFPIFLSDYDIQRPQFMMLVLEDKVDISLDIEANKQ